MLKEIFKFISFIILYSSLAFNAFANEEQKEQKLITDFTKIPDQVLQQISPYLLQDNSDLSLSAAVRKIQGKYFLIIELDHNPNLNEISLVPFHQHLLELPISGVIKENKAFGFSNKPVAFLPIIEMAHTPETKENSSAVMLSSLTNNRTQQIIDLSQAVETYAQNQRLVGLKGTQYSAEDIQEVSLMFTSNKIGSPSAVSYIRINLSAVSNLKEGELLQVHGSTPIKNIEADQNRFLVKDTNLQDQTLFRYISHLFNGREQSIVDRPQRIAQALSSLPFEIPVDIIEEFSVQLRSAEASQMLQAINLLDQEYNQPLKNVSCKALLN